MKDLTLFDSIPPNDTLGVLADSGNQYAEVASITRLSKRDLARLADLSVNSVRYDDRIPTSVRRILDTVTTIVLIVAEQFSGDLNKTKLWFSTANPLLGDVAPSDMIRVGREKKLLSFVQKARYEASRGEKVS